MNFNAMLGRYAEYKRRNGRKGTISMREARILKKNLLKESKKIVETGGDAKKVREAMKRSPLFKALAESFIKYKKDRGDKPSLREMTTLLDKYARSRRYLEKFFEYKKSKNSKPTLKEATVLIEKLTSRKPIREASKPTKEGFQKYVEAYKSYKRKEKGNSKLTEKELSNLKARYLSKFKESTVGQGSFEKLLENYKTYKKAANKGGKISYKEMKVLKEAFKKNPKLKEAGEEFAAAPPPVNAADPNAIPVQGAAEGASPEITAAVQGIKSQVDGLAQQIGLVNDNLGGDPTAGIPPVDGTGAAPGGDGQPVMETTKDRAAAIRERINARAKVLKEEGGLAGLTKAAHEAGAAGIPNLGGPNTDTGKSGETNASPYATVPSADQLARGKDGGKGASAGNTWPTKKDVPGQGKPLQGAGVKYTSKVEENIEDVTKAYVDRALAPKLDYTALTEALKIGRLG